MAPFRTWKGTNVLFKNMEPFVASYTLDYNHTVYIMESYESVDPSGTNLEAGDASSERENLGLGIPRRDRELLETTLV